MTSLDSRSASPLRDLRTARGWSERHAASLLGIDRRTLQRYETGEREPSASVLGMLVEVYRLEAFGLRELIEWYSRRDPLRSRVPPPCGIEPSR